MSSRSRHPLWRRLPPLAAAVVCLVATGCRRPAAPPGPAPSTGPPDAVVSPEVAPDVVRDAAARDLLRITPVLDRGDVDEAAERFYSRRSFQLAWFEHGQPVPAAQALVTCLRHAAEEGLDPQSYRPLQLQELLRAPPPPHSVDLAAADAAFTRAFLTYALHRLRGRVHPHTVNMAWYSTPRRRDLAAVLATALRNESIERELAGLDPPYPAFAALRLALAHFRRIAADGGWAVVPAGPPLHDGDAAPCPRLTALHSRLAVEGFAAPRLRAAGTTAGRPEPAEAGAAAAPCIYDGVLAEEVGRFQAAHGVSPDGVLGPATLHELNEPAAVRVRQIELNMERWRWLPDTLGDPSVLVNLAAYRLAVVEHGEPVLTMRVIVGKEGWKTPVFSDKIQEIVLNPYWNVPESIAAEEILPAVRSDPTYLVRNGFEVLEGWGDHAVAIDPSRVSWAELAAAGSAYHYRQRPGPANPLGTIKFLFPNAFAIYLHGSPGASLFALTARAQSHGCVRLEHPLALAAYLLRDEPEWSREKLTAAITSGRRVTIRLREPVPVHLLYWTAEEHDGRLELLPDVYGVDAALAAELDRPAA